MSQYYHVFGLLFSALSLAAIYGVWLQLKLILSRKKETGIERGFASDNISINRTLGSYLAFYANFLLGLSFTEIDPYLASTRFLAIVLLLATFFEIFKDRQSGKAKSAFIFTSALFALSLFYGIFMRHILVDTLFFIQCFAAFSALFLIQGYIHQISVLRKTKRIGALSKKAFQMFIIKEISTLFFAATLGFSDAWSLYFMSGSLLICEIILLFYINKFENIANKAENKKP